MNSQDAREWLSGLKSYTRRWIEKHKDGGVDHWTVAAFGVATPAAMLSSRPSSGGRQQEYV